MSAFSNPIWEGHFAGLLTRIPMGLYFFTAGHMKYEDVGNFVETVRRFNIIPDQFEVLYGVMLPWLEMGVGVALILGLWTTIASGLASLLILSYIVALGLHPVSPELFNKDIILLGGVLSLLASGAGAFSVDKFRKG